MTNRKLLTDYVYRIVATLLQHGVEDVVISPGSRSTPLAYAFATTQQVRLHRQIDERSAAFYALGIAKAKLKPVVLVCTSGTAAANYFPAIIEAKYARVPIIVLTADRPHELREVGAPQAIQQIQLYGEHVKWFAEFPIPDDASVTLPYVERHTVRAVMVAMSAPLGPVHLNIPFREPLLIDFQSLPNIQCQQSFPGELLPSIQAFEMLTDVIGHTNRGLIVIGELPLQTNRQALWSFIRKCRWPVVVESLSNMRTNIPKDCLPYIISTYDALLKSKGFQEKIKPETVIRFGAQPVSKFLSLFIQQAQPANYIVVDEGILFRDSISTTTQVIQAVPSKWLERLAIQSTIDKCYVEVWQQAEKIAVEQVTRYANEAQDEGAIVQAFLNELPASANLFVSNSMPIRDVDTFLTATEHNTRLFANRGANGIDGVTSTALGFAVADNNPTYLLIGDLAFLHDSSALLATRYQACPLTIVVLNNDGGGIFSYLPQAQNSVHFEDLFGTPTALSFEHLAAMYEMHYDCVETVETFVQALQSTSEERLRLIEVKTNRTENVIAHRQLWANIQRELDRCILQ